jgi:hypothetical protein
MSVIVRPPFRTKRSRGFQESASVLFGTKGAVTNNCQSWIEPQFDRIVGVVDSRSARPRKGDLYEKAVQFSDFANKCAPSAFFDLGN